MNGKSPSYAIAFSAKKIAFYEKGLDMLWTIREEIPVDPREPSKVKQIFKRRSIRWRAYAREIYLFLSPEFCQIKDWRSSHQFLEDVDLQNELEVEDISEIHVFHSAKGERYLVTSKPVFEEAMDLVTTNSFIPLGLCQQNLDAKIRVPDPFNIGQKTDFRYENKKWSLVERTTELVPIDTADRKVNLPAIIEERPREVTPFITKPRAFGALGIMLACVGAVGFFLYSAYQEQRAYEQRPAFTTSENYVAPSDLDVDVAEIPPEEVYEGEFLPADTLYAFRPDDHNQYASQFSIETPLIIEGAPDFKVVSRPEDHGTYSENLLAPREATPFARDDERIEASASRAQAIKDAEPEFLGEDSEGFFGGPPPLFGDLPRQSLSGVEAGPYATIPGGIDTTDISLLGVFGQPTSLQALIRTPNGQTKMMSKGDIIAGWQLVSISRSEVIISNGTAERRLDIPN